MPFSKEKNKHTSHNNFRNGAKQVLFLFLVKACFCLTQKPILFIIVKHNYINIKNMSIRRRNKK